MSVFLVGINVLPGRGLHGPRVRRDRQGVARHSRKGFRAVTRLFRLSACVQAAWYGKFLAHAG